MTHLVTCPRGFTQVLTDLNVSLPLITAEENCVSRHFSVTTLLECYKPKCVGRCELEREGGERGDGRTEGSTMGHMVSVPECEVGKGW